MQQRITPAYAGKTKTEKGEPKKEQDHPRVCGENLLVLFFGLTPLGSPPRMRGKLQLSGLWYLGTRITPAYAGKTNFLVNLFAFRRDHPRVCGENDSGS